jgi:hypothetical protein
MGGQCVLRPLRSGSPKEKVRAEPVRVRIRTGAAGPSREGEPLFGPRLIRTEVWSRDCVLLQTASRHSHPVDKYGLCGTRLINKYFVETNKSMVVR